MAIRGNPPLVSFRSPHVLSTGDQLEIVVGDVSQPTSLKPELFKEVVAVVGCTAAIVMPKEGDGPDRAKYYQGIKVRWRGIALSISPVCGCCLPG